MVVLTILVNTGNLKWVWPTTQTGFNDNCQQQFFLFYKYTADNCNNYLQITLLRATVKPTLFP